MHFCTFLCISSCLRHFPVIFLPFLFCVYYSKSLQTIFPKKFPMLFFQCFPAEKCSCQTVFFICILHLFATCIFLHLCIFSISPFFSWHIFRCHAAMWVGFLPFLMRSTHITPVKIPGTFQPVSIGSSEHGVAGTLLEIGKTHR